MDDRAEEVQRVLDAVSAFAASDEPLAERGRRLLELRTAVAFEIRREVQQVVREMKGSGMSLREIGDALDLSFGRVRQILAEELDPPPGETE